MKNHREHPLSHQSGVALVLALLFLFILTVIGVAGFSNTHLQERSAGNIRLQTTAFEAAAAGAVNSINFFEANRDRTDINILDTACGDTGHDGWYDAEGNALPSDWVSMDPIGEASLSQRIYCLADEYPCTVDDDAECGIRPPRSQLFVLSRGDITVDGKTVASRDIEVRLAIGRKGTPGDGCGAICFPGCDINENDTVFPNSNAFQVDGGGGFAITAGCQAGADTILDKIKNNRIGNYVGGIGSSGAGSPWNDPVATENFRANVAATAAADNSCGNCYYPYGLNTSGNSEFGTIDSPQITYVEGDADIGGSISGAGIFLVNGDLHMNGTPAYQGLIVVLGGDWEIKGGGKGGNPGKDQPQSGGSVVVLNAPGNGTFGEVSFDNNGGGNALYRYDCDMLNAVRLLLDLDGQAMWNPECNGVPGIFAIGPEEMIIASWRENIGWREELFESN